MERLEPIRIGIVGCGRVAWERHYPALRRTPQVEVVAVCDPNPDALAHLGGLFACRERFERYQELLAQPGLDAVAVLTPTGSHAEIGVAALEAGKHLFLEKPVALTLAEADRLISARRGADRVALLCFNLRWHRLVRQARAFVGTGALGQIRAIRSVYTHDRDGSTAPDWHRRLELGGGVSFNEAVHHYDLWRYLLGLEVEEVISRSLPSGAYEDETNVVCARLTGGVLATGLFSFLTGPNSEVEIFGTRGRLVVSLYRFDGLEFFPTATYPGDLADRARKSLKSLLALPALVRETHDGGAFQATFAGVWRHFVGCVRGTARPECTLEDGRAALAIALGAVESSHPATKARG